MLAKIARDLVIAALVACMLAGGALYVRSYTDNSALDAQLAPETSTGSPIASVDTSGVYPVLRLRESNHLQVQQSSPVKTPVNKPARVYVAPAAVDAQVDPGGLDNQASRMISQQGHPVTALGEVMDPETDTQFNHEAVPRFIGEPLDVDDYLAGRR